MDIDRLLDLWQVGQLLEAPAALVANQAVHLDHPRARMRRRGSFADHWPFAWRGKLLAGGKSIIHAHGSSPVRPSMSSFRIVRSSR
jgi:hypothetical protein